MPAVLWWASINARRVTKMCEGCPRRHSPGRGGAGSRERERSVRGGGVNLGTSKSGTCKGCRIPTVAEVPGQPGSRGGADNPRPTDPSAYSGTNAGPAADLGLGQAHQLSSPFLIPSLTKHMPMPYYALPIRLHSPICKYCSLPALQH
jgi:hypothetical protein